MWQSSAKRFLDIAYGREVQVTREQVERIPYAILGIQVHDRLQAVLVLQYAREKELHWLASDRTGLVTQHGRLLQTVGMDQNLTHTTFPNGSAPDGQLHTLSGPVDLLRLVDLSPGQHFNLPIHATLVPQGRERIEILGQARETVHILERSACPLLEWEFVNHYWVDPDNGTVWRSTQAYYPGADPLTMELFKPYGGA